MQEIVYERKRKREKREIHAMAGFFLGSLV
jgi:hypothetical protein